MRILHSTTRWRPQHDPLADPTNGYQQEPIEIDFSGPADLDLSTPGTLEIQGPVGTITVSGRITKDPEAGVPYRMEWKEPFTYTDPADGQVKPLPAANYLVVVKATKGPAPNQEVLASQPYDKLSFVEVKNVELAPCGSITGVPPCPDGGAVVTNNQRSDRTPMPGGGKAAFPDAISSGGDLRRTILVKAELEPNLGEDASQVKVFFRWIDVDDPSAGGRDAQGNPIHDPVDNDTVSIPDNRNENAEIVTPTPASPTQDGAAVTYFRVSTQQANNYRVAASTLESWLTGIQSAVISQAGEVTHTSGEQLLDAQLAKGPQVSEMLAVWHTLHLELKRCLPPSQALRSSKSSAMVSGRTLEGLGAVCRPSRRVGCCWIVRRGSECDASTRTALNAIGQSSTARRPTRYPRDQTGELSKGKRSHSR